MGPLQLLAISGLTYMSGLPQEESAGWDFHTWIIPEDSMVVWQY